MTRVPGWMLLLGTIALILVRAPSLLLHPRIWAEEGVYLTFALNHSFLQTIFHLHPASGYYVFSADLSAALSALVVKTAGLEYAPFVSTYFSLCLQIVPFAILIFGKSHLFRTRAMIAAGCLIILFAPTTSGEIWLNAINSISWTGLIAFIVLFEDTTNWSRKKRAAFRLLLILCGISGPYAAVTFPLFAFSYFVYREKERLVQALLLFSCTLLQLGIFEIVRLGGGAASRLQSFSLDSALVNILYFHVARALAGESGATVVLSHLGMADSIQKSIATPRGGPVILAGYFSALVILLILSCLWDKKLRSQKTLLIGTFLLFSAFTASAAAFGVPSNRYAFLPGLSLLLLLACNACENRHKVVRVICGVLLIYALGTGARDYKQFWRMYGAGCPAWPDEVQKWRADHSYTLRVWPAFFPPLVRWDPNPHSKSRN